MANPYFCRHLTFSQFFMSSGTQVTLFFCLFTYISFRPKRGGRLLFYPLNPSVTKHGYSHLRPSYSRPSPLSDYSSSCNDESPAEGPLRVNNGHLCVLCILDVPCGTGSLGTLVVVPPRRSGRDKRSSTSPKCP